MKLGVSTRGHRRKPHDKRTNIHDASSATEPTVKRLALTVLVALLATTLVELAVFDFNQIESRFYPAAPQAVSTSSNVSGNVAALSSGDPIASFDFQNADIRSVSLSAADNPAHLSVSISDEANAAPYEVANIAVDGHTDLRIRPSGAVKRVEISLVSVNADEQPIPTTEVHVEFNQAWPIDIGWTRCACVFACALFALIVRRNSPLSKPGGYASLPFGVITCTVAVLAIIVMVLPQADPLPSGTYVSMGYAYLADALCSGQLNVDIPVSDGLLALDNPYDPSQRAAAGVPFAWDYAYYNGSYYVYFGIVPALILFVPYHAITGGDFSKWLAALIFIAFATVGAFALLRAVCKRWFPRTSQAGFLLALVMFLCGSWISYAIVNAGFYVLPETSGLAFLLFGWAFWIRATGTEHIRTASAILGSVCVALTLGCRPQLFAGAVLGLVLIAPYLLNAKRRTAQNLRIIALATIPFLMVAAALGWYNWARFGSPFDFGANYNLTTNDMRYRGFSLGRLAPALFHYLFQTPTLSLAPPHIGQVSLASSYHGIEITEPMIGGLLAVTPWIPVALFLLLDASTLRSRMLRAAAVACLTLGVAVVVFDANGAGILMRYFLDFGILFSFPAVIATLSMREKTEEAARRDEWPAFARPINALLTTSGVLSLAVQLTFFYQGIWS